VETKRYQEGDKEPAGYLKLDVQRKNKTEQGEAWKKQLHYLSGSLSKTAPQEKRLAMDNKAAAQRGTR